METLKVLVVDDEPGIRLGIARVLQGYKVRVVDLNGEVAFAVSQAESGEEALALLGADAPDILLLDHKLPGISGLEVLDIINKEPHDWLTVMITAYATIDTAVHATKHGAHDFLAKPFTPEELKSTIYKAAKHLVLQREARRLAAEKRQVRFQAISVLAHELKAPLAAVEGYLEVLKDGVAAPGTPEFRDVINRSVGRIGGMRKMILDLLDLTAIESGQKRRELAEVDARAVAERAIETARTAAGERAITIELHAPAAMPMTADAGELEIVLNNLVSNAVKYNRDGGRVDVTFSEADGKIVLAVADTGIGLAPEEAAQVGGEFVRIKNAKTRRIMGSGLGLSIVKKLASLYGGELSIASTPDVGSTFTVTLSTDGNG